MFLFICCLANTRLNQTDPYNSQRLEMVLIILYHILLSPNDSISRTFISRQINKYPNRQSQPRCWGCPSPTPRMVAHLLISHKKIKRHTSKYKIKIKVISCLQLELRKKNQNFNCVIILQLIKEFILIEIIVNPLNLSCDKVIGR